MSVQDKNPTAIKDLIGKLSKRVSVTVGIHAEQGAAAKEEPDPKAPATDVATVAAAHEFGIGTVPRPFVSGWVDEHEAEANRALKQVMVPVATGKATAEQQAQRFGLWAAGQMQQRMADGIPPELSERRRAEKAATGVGPKDTPLIYTEQLRSSIRSKVQIG